MFSNNQACFSIIHRLDYASKMLLRKTSYISYVVYYVATWATFKPKLKKMNKFYPEKSLLFHKMELCCPEKLNKTFSYS